MPAITREVISSALTLGSGFRGNDNSKCFPVKKVVAVNSETVVARWALGLSGYFVSCQILEHDFYKKVYVACFNDAKGHKVIQWTTINYFINKKELLNVIDWGKQ